MNLETDMENNTGQVPDDFRPNSTNIYEPGNLRDVLVSRLLNRALLTQVSSLVFWLLSYSSLSIGVA